MNTESFADCISNSFLAQKEKTAITFLRNGKIETKFSYLSLVYYSSILIFQIPHSQYGLPQMLNVNPIMYMILLILINHKYLLMDLQYLDLMQKYIITNLV